jgi:hypothetical protein
MPESISDITRRLAENAEAVCRHYLSNGRREGRYWLVGDVHNTPGRSLYVRLDGARGRWTDAATGQYGDLLDLIAAAHGLDSVAEAMDEARRFFGRPSTRKRGARSMPSAPFPRSSRSATGGAFSRRTALTAVPTGTAQAARRLFQRSSPIAGTIAETYLRARGIAATPDMTALRFHPCCWYRPEAGSPKDARDTWPALIAAVTDQDGAVTGVQRTWLDPSGVAKAPVAVPRRAMGHLLGHAVRFGTAGDVMAAGEGIETVLSLRGFMPTLPLAAALSAAHLAGMLFPPGLRRLYIVRDNDPAGQRASATLTARAQAGGVEAMTLVSALKDFNDDLRQRDAAALAASVRGQLAPEDVTRFWCAPEQKGHIR